MDYPGIASTNSLPYNPQISSVGSTVYVAWQDGMTNNNSIYLKTWSGSQWGDIDGSGSNNVINVGSNSTLKAMVVNPVANLPIIAVVNGRMGNDFYETLVFSYVGPVTPAPFLGIDRADGTESNTVMTSWSPVVSPAETILYHVYRWGDWAASETNLPSLTDPATIASVFQDASIIASITNGSQYLVTGLTADRKSYYGVRSHNQTGLHDSNTRIVCAGPYNLLGDQDMDWLLTLEERSVSNNLVALGLQPLILSPTVYDTDGDGMWDGWEFYYSNLNTGQYNTAVNYGVGSASNMVAHNTNAPYMKPFDNGTRDLSSTNAYARALQGPYDDLDGDGLMNIEEFDWWRAHNWVADFMNAPNGGGRSNVTNWWLDPTNPDSDGDTMSDGWEYFNGLNPGYSADATNAAPGDPSMTCSQKFYYACDPNLTDSDNDGITDSNEVFGVVRTDPSNADSDGDGLEDGLEILIGSSPVCWDSNTNGVSDGDEYQVGFANPLLLNSVVRLVYSNDFQTFGSVTNWGQFSTAAMLWHRTQADPDKPVDGAAVSVNTHTTNWSLRCANDPTYADTNATYDINGQSMDCWMTSPNFNATGTTNLFITWVEYYETEILKDVCAVYGSSDRTNWFLLRPGVSGFTGGWVRRTADMSQFAGQASVQVRFEFMADDKNNSYHGWYIDDVRVYGGTRITGYVRDVNGRPLNRATVFALGRGGVTNTVGTHKYELPGKIMGMTQTREDGSYTINGLYQGRYCVKATYTGYKASFWNGVLYTNNPFYTAFGQRAKAGVSEIGLVTTLADLTAPSSSTNCDFELERGAARGSLAVLMPLPPASLPVYLDQAITNYVMWNGKTNGAEWVPFLVTNSVSATYPDWETNNWELKGTTGTPVFISDIDEGNHPVFLHPGWANMPFVSRIEVPIRDGEITKVYVVTNGSSARIDLYSEVGGCEIWIDDRYTSYNTAFNNSPVVIPVLAGSHEVALRQAVSNEWVCPKMIQAPANGRTQVWFTAGEVWSTKGSITINTVDMFGSVITNARVVVDGRVIAQSNVVSSLLTPVTIKDLNVGSHWITVMKDGYRLPPRQRVTVLTNLVNALTIPLYEADKDYDGVGDGLEAEGYTNLVLFSRSDDPDKDGLSNYTEYEQYTHLNARMSILDSDVDRDRMSDGEELGFDGNSNWLAKSTLFTNSVAYGTNIMVRFEGHFLEGSNVFNTASIATTSMWLTVNGDMFLATNFAWAAGDFGAPVLDFFIPSYGSSNRLANSGHLRDDTVYGDTFPLGVDTDGDGMWDGFENRFIWVGGLHPLENGAKDNDPDNDNLSNYGEFLGGDGKANTNDWSNPGQPDSDGDTIPDGWEIEHGLDPMNQSDAGLDKDGDGLTNVEEWQWRTDPEYADSDRDGVIDGEEVHRYGTNPLLWDTDYDGLSDGQEVVDTDMNPNSGVDGGFFPNWDVSRDTDHDGLPDGPTDWDSDGDGMPDGFEVADPYLFSGLGLRPQNQRLDPSNPNDAVLDADGDGLSNLQEYLVRDGLIGMPPNRFTRQSNWYYVPVETNGAVAVEVECRPQLDNWLAETNFPGYMTAGTEWNCYYEWYGTYFGTNAPERPLAPDETTSASLLYEVQFTNEVFGQYTFELRQCHPSSVVQTQNQVWVRFNYEDWLIARSIMGGTNGVWTYSTELRTTNGVLVPNTRWCSAGINLVVELAGKNVSNCVDRFILYRNGVDPNVARTNAPSPWGETWLDDVVWDYSTNPFNADTDGDGFPDGYETWHGLHPMDPIGSQQAGGGTFFRYGRLGKYGDLDSDGVMNWNEYSVRFMLDQNANGLAIEGSCDPWSADSDQDGLEDAEEIKTFASHPLNQDTDFDGIKDGGKDTAFPSEVDTGHGGAARKQYDMALNDIWHMAKPPGYEYPYWVRDMTHDPNRTNYPAPRWGGGIASFGYMVTDDADGNYVGRYSPAGDGNTPGGQLLLNNSSTVIFGGRDGTRHFDEIWETKYGEGYNIWEFKGRLIGYPCGDTEVSIAQKTYVIDTYDESKPVLRPRPGGPPGFLYYRSIMGGMWPIMWGPNPASQTKNNWGRALVMGGWDMYHTFHSGGFENLDGAETISMFLPRYYKTEDDTNIVVEFGWRAMTEAYQIPYNDTTGVMPLRDPEGITTVPFGYTNMIVKTPTLYCYTGFNFPYIFNSLNDIGPRSSITAVLSFDWWFDGPGQIQVKLFGEMHNRARATIENGTLHSTYSSPPTYPTKDSGPYRRATTGWPFRTVATNIETFMVSGYSTTNINVTTQVVEMIRARSGGTRFEYGNNMGFVLFGEPLIAPCAAAMGDIVCGSQTLHIWITTPQYCFPNNTRQVTEWEPPDVPAMRVTWQAGLGNWVTPIAPPPAAAPKMHPHRRKSAGLTYDGTRFVIFGGVNELRALNDVWTSIDGFDDWVRYYPEQTPPARWAHGMAPAAGGVVVFGGFDSNNRPLNDAWFFSTTDNQWTKLVPSTGEEPPVRGGCAMGSVGGVITMFGGTDGKRYFNDTWALEMDAVTGLVSACRWVCINPNGANSRGYDEMGLEIDGPSPRAFMAHSTGLQIFGGRCGLLPGGIDTDEDGISDDVELQLGGPVGGRDPRANALIPGSAALNTNAVGEKYVYTYKRFGGVNAAYGYDRPYVADFESIEYYARTGANDHPMVLGLVGEGHEGATGMFDSGYDSYSSEYTDLWWHRYGVGNPLDPRDVWQLGTPHPDNLSTNAAPPCAHSGRWCYGTNLKGYYPDDAIMELYSPLFSLTLPDNQSSDPANMNRLYLEFYEWLHLADTNDVVWIDVIRPSTLSDVRTRTPGVSPPRPTINLLDRRNNAYNTTGEWRRVILPLQRVANETNLYLKFCLQSDASGHGGGWYIDDVAVIQGGDIWGSYPVSARFYLYGEFSSNALYSVTNDALWGTYVFDLLPSGNYRLLASDGGTYWATNAIGQNTWIINASDFTVEDVAMSVTLTVNSPAKLTWNTTPGVTYEVQYATPESILTSHPWTTLSTIKATSTTTTFIDLDSETATSRFYRIVMIGVVP
jgi:hypothetical protein